MLDLYSQACDPGVRGVVGVEKGLEGCEEASVPPFGSDQRFPGSKTFTYRLQWF